MGRSERKRSNACQPRLPEMWLQAANKCRVGKNLVWSLAEQMKEARSRQE